MDRAVGTNGPELEALIAGDPPAVRPLTDPELVALQGMIDLMADMDPGMRHRVLLYMCRRYDARLLDTRFRYDLPL